MRRIFLLATLILIGWPLQTIARQVNVLVVALHGVEVARQDWLPTIDFLEEALSQHDFSLLPVLPGETHEIAALIQSDKIDFVISQPAIYVDLELNFGISRILTMVKHGGYSQFGSAIIVRADSDIHSFEALRGKTVAGVARLGFGGWLVGYKEMLDNGFDPYSEARQVQFLGTQPNEVHAVLDGRVDAAVIRTGVLEKLSAAGEISMGDFRLLSKKSYPGFDMKVSTPLYPEWAFAKTHRASNALTREVALALLSLGPDSPAAQQAGFDRWTFPYDYQPVHNLLKQLQIGPYHGYGKVSWWAFALDHWPELVTIALLLLVIVLVIVIWNRKLEKEILDRRAAERRLREHEKGLLLAASVFSHTGEGIVITNPEGRILDVNKAFTRITGYEREEVLGANPRLLQSGRHDAEFYRAMWRELKNRGYWSGEIWNRRKDLELYAEKLSINAVVNEAGDVQHYVGIFSDYTHRLMYEQQMEHLAHYDALTDLPNRVLLADRLEQAMKQVERRGKQLAVVYLDLDGFKEVNDSYGHSVGDQLLIAISGRLREVLRLIDTLARLGGDEFVVVLSDFASNTDCVPLLQRLLSVSARPLHIDDRIVQVSASLGVAFYPQAVPIDAAQLLRQADQAMYQAKLAGKNCYQLFNAEQERSVRGCHESVERIRQALAESEFILQYQPEVNMRTGVVTGAEVVTRWQHPEKGLLPSSHFTPVIENHPLSAELDTWVLGEAIAQFDRWHRQGLNVGVSINVSTYDIQQPDFVERIKRQLAAYPELEPGFLELEVPENSALADLSHVAYAIEACAAIGVRFVLDDFGTGFSSLTYLKQLPASVLKIDRSFVGDMLDNPDSQAILRGILGLAAAFQREVIAEGVESVEHGKLLLQLGCELGQGKGIAEPMPAASFPGWVASWKPYPEWVAR